MCGSQSRRGVQAAARHARVPRSGPSYPRESRLGDVRTVKRNQPACRSARHGYRQLRAVTYRPRKLAWTCVVVRAEYRAACGMRCAYKAGASSTTTHLPGRHIQPTGGQHVTLWLRFATLHVVRCKSTAGNEAGVLRRVKGRLSFRSRDRPRMRGKRAHESAAAPRIAATTFSIMPSLRPSELHPLPAGQMWATRRIV